MTLGERCDEILRLIDETLADVAAEGDESVSAPGPEAALTASLGSLPAAS